MKKRVVIALSGSSGVELGLKFARKLPQEIEKHIIASDHAHIVLEKESNTTLHTDDAIWASIASGSFAVDAYVIIPCSMNTLAKIACGISDTLTTRIGAVAIKERKPLLLAPRELPFSAIALENMLKLARLGVIIAPPVVGYYAHIQTLEEMEDFLIGKWFDQLDIPHTLYRRWGEEG